MENLEFDTAKHKERMDKLREAADPLLKLLNTDYHPHVKVIIDSTSIELLEGLVSIPKIYEHLVD